MNSTERKLNEDSIILDLPLEDEDRQGNGLSAFFGRQLIRNQNKLHQIAQLSEQRGGQASSSSYTPSSSLSSSQRFELVRKNPQQILINDEVEGIYPAGSIHSYGPSDAMATPDHTEVEKVQFPPRVAPQKSKSSFQDMLRTPQIQHLSAEPLTSEQPQNEKFNSQDQVQEQASFERIRSILADRTISYLHSPKAGEIGAPGSEKILAEPSLERVQPHRKSTLNHPPRALRREEMASSDQQKSAPPKSVLSSKKKSYIMNMLGVKDIRVKESDSSSLAAISEEEDEEEEEEHIILTLDDIDNKNYGILKLFNLVVCLSLVAINLCLCFFPASSPQKIVAVIQLIFNAIWSISILRHCEYSSPPAPQVALYLVFMIQFVMRLADFEGTRAVYNRSTFATVYQFYFTVAASMHLLFFLLFRQVSPDHVVLSNAGFVTLGLLGLVALVNCFRSDKDEAELEDFVVTRIAFKLLTFAYWWFCFLVLSYLQRNKQSEAIDMMEQLQELRKILNNLDESIFILSDRIEFANDTFLRHFHSIIECLSTHRPMATSCRRSSGSSLTGWQKVVNMIITTWNYIIVRLAAHGKALVSLAKLKVSSADLGISCTMISEEMLYQQQLLSTKIFGEFQLDVQGFKNDRNHIENTNTANISETASRRESILNLVKKYSINDFLQMPEETLDSLRFTVRPPGAEESVPSLYLRVRIIKYVRSGEQKKIVQFIDVSQDIQQDQYKVQTQLLEMINACVSHELRNPLNSIVAQNTKKKSLYSRLSDMASRLEKALKSPDLKDDVEQTVNSFQLTLRDLQKGMVVQESSANVMGFLIQDLLDYAQIKAGKFRKNISSFDIRKSIETVMCIQRQKALDNQIEFYPTFINFADSPEEADDVLFSPIVYSDEERIMQVLLGLQSNALKFTMEGKVEIQVRILEQDDELYLQISVVDTGEGIPFEDQDKLFQLFGFVKDKKKMNTKGIGLGLVISDQIVTQFGGKITFKSVPKEGSTFTFTFKLSDEQEVENQPQLNGDLANFQLNSSKLYFTWKPKAKRARTSARKKEGSANEEADLPLPVEYVCGLGQKQRSPQEPKKSESEGPENYIEALLMNRAQDHSNAPGQGASEEGKEDCEQPPPVQNQFLSLQGFARVAARDRSVSMHKPVPTPQLSLDIQGGQNMGKNDEQAEGLLEESSGRILMVDDQSFNLDALEIILTHTVGIDGQALCDKALSGKEALALVKKNVMQNDFSKCDYKLILMDCNMPFMSGYEACAVIRQYLYDLNLDQPVISAVTGHSEQSYVELAIEAGMNQVLSKPVKGELLKELVMRLGL